MAYESEEEQADTTGHQSLKASFVVKLVGPVAPGAKFERTPFVQLAHVS